MPYVEVSPGRFVHLDALGSDGAEWVEARRSFMRTAGRAAGGVGSPAPAPAPATATASAGAVVPLKRLGGLVGAPGLAAAVRGTDEQQRRAVSLIVAAVRAHGADAPGAVAAAVGGASTTDSVLGANLARAAVELQRAIPMLLDHQAERGASRSRHRNGGR